MFATDEIKSGSKKVNFHQHCVPTRRTQNGFSTEGHVTISNVAYAVPEDT